MLTTTRNELGKERQTHRDRDRETGTETDRETEAVETAEMERQTAEMERQAAETEINAVTETGAMTEG